MYFIIRNICISFLHLNKISVNGFNMHQCLLVLPRVPLMIVMRNTDLRFLLNAALCECDSESVN